MTASQDLAERPKPTYRVASFPDAGAIVSLVNTAYRPRAGQKGWTHEADLLDGLIYRRRFATRAEATTAIFDYIEGFYNRTRLHSALGYQSPLDYESSLS